MYVCVNVSAIVKLMCVCMRVCLMSGVVRGEEESMDRFRDLGSIVNRHSCVKSSK